MKGRLSPIVIAQIIKRVRETPRKEEIKIILRKNTLLTKKRFRLSGIKNPTLPLNRCRKDVRAAFSRLLRSKSTDYSHAAAKIIFILKYAVFP